MNLINFYKSLKRKRETERQADVHAELERYQEQTKIDSDITIDDCIGWLLIQAENVHPDSQTAKKARITVHFLQTLQQQNEAQQIWMKELNDRSKFWNDFMKYINENAVGDKLTLIQTVQGNEYNRSDGYIKVQKRINEKQELLLDFTTSKGDKRTAAWQPSDNYACWQTCGIAGDDYSGFLLMPTYKDDEYFCIYYQC